MPQESYSGRNNPAFGNDHLRRVREAADALFRPKTPALSERNIQPKVGSESSTVTEATPAETATVQPPAVVTDVATRVARLLPVQMPQVEQTPQVDPVQRAPHVVPERKQAAARGTATLLKSKIRNKIPKSEGDRIRVLVGYGMTIEQVAALYDVSIRTIEKIIL